MRVLHVYKTYYPDTYGGIEQVIYQLSQGCARRGIAADVFTFSPDKETGPVAYEDHRVIYNKQLFEIASTPFSLKALKRFKQIKDDYDIINYHFPFPFMDMLHLSARPDARTVVTYHSDIVKQKRLMKLYQPLQERFLASVDCIVASSPNYVASSQTLKKYQDKTVVIPFGLEQHDVQHDPQRVAHWRETVGDNFFLFVGAFRYYKGLHILLDAAERSRLPVVIVGGGPLELSLAGVGAFGEGADIHAVWAGVEENEGLKRLARACEIAARRAGLKAETRAYKPHVTLAYLRRPDPAEVAAWIQANNLLRTEPFRITSFGLYSSWRSDQGSWYRLEREYPLY